MIKTLINLVELAVIAQVIYKTGRFLLGKKSRKGKSIMGKISVLVSNRIHHGLDKMIREQQKRLADGQQTSNVVSFKKYKTNKA